MSYDFVIDYADYVASSEISTSSFHDVDSLIPFQSPLVDAGTEVVRLSKMHTGSVTSFTIKKADAEVVPIVKMTPSVDYVSSGEVDVKAAVLMALADVNAVAETEEGKTFLIDNTNIT